VAAAFSGPVTHPPAGNPTFWMKSGNDVYYNVVNGNVGIGTNGPAYKLDVQNGQINSSGGFCIAGNCKTDWNQIAGYWTLNGSSLYPNLTSYILGVGTASLDPNYKITTSGGGIKAESTSQPAGYFSSVSGYGLLVNTGYVGIGTTAPSELLEVSKSQVGYTAIKVTNSEDAGNASTGFTAKGGAGNRGGSLVYYGPGYTPGGGSELLAANSVVISSHSGVTNGIRIIAANDGTHSAPIIFATGQWYATAAERMRITSTGNVGIGTTNPRQRLEVKGAQTGGTESPILISSSGSHVWAEVRSSGDGANNAGIRFNNFDRTSGTAQEWGVGYLPASCSGNGFCVTDQTLNTPRMVIRETTGNVGIGTTNPGVPLDISNSAATLFRAVGTGAAGTDNIIRVINSTGVDTALISGSSAGNIGIVGTQNNYNFALRTNNVNRVFIDTSGNVGIGTASPGARLDVGGGNIVGVNKLTVNSIDPIFKINGKNYATYVSDFAGGLRVETSGILKVDSNYEIDFNNLNEGSDLWLFWQASNKNINDVAVILTPSFDGKVWYEKGDNKITIHTEKPGEISYRLSAPRIDNKEGNNLAEDQTIKGIDVLDYSK
jgi:hypothetical protein